jgi:hydroxymethylpyrimidine pyrophosphatase-like HAD family hydrolase
MFTGASHRPWIATKSTSKAVRRSVQQMVIAVDVDGTLFDGAEVAPQAIEALRAATSDGHTLVIVTGRRWEELGHVVPDVVAMTDRVICEEGGVLVNVGTAELTLLADPAESGLIDALRAAGVPNLDVGHVVIGAPTASLDLVTEVRDRVGSQRRIIINKGSVALAPEGCDKGAGLRAAIADLHLEGLPIIAIGDASNDVAMFNVATIAVGVANSDDAVRASGVQLTRASFGSGVAEALRQHLPAPRPD